MSQSITKSLIKFRTCIRAGPSINPFLVVLEEVSVQEGVLKKIARSRSLAGVPLEALRHKVACDGRQDLRDLGADALLIRKLAHEPHRVEVALLERVRQLAHQQLHHHDAKAPDVRRQHGGTLRLLRRDVLRRAHDGVALDFGLVNSRAKIAQLRSAVHRQEHVVRLHVAVDDAVGVQERQAGQHVRRVPLHAGHRQRLEALHDVHERAAGDVLHDDDDEGAHDGRRVARDHVGVLHVRQQRHLLDQGVELALDLRVGVAAHAARVRRRQTHLVAQLAGDRQRLHRHEQSVRRAHAHVDLAERAFAQHAVGALPAAAVAVQELRLDGGELLEGGAVAAVAAGGGH
eukprot:PhM_4_TR10009/c1_g1_i3/m.90311